MRSASRSPFHDRHSGKTMTVISMRVLNPDDWPLWRAMRLAALSEAPYAFVSTLEEWTGDGDTEKRWRDRLVSVPFNLIAELDGQPVGMASGSSPANEEIELISMWVDPSARGHAVGDALVEAIIAWAVEQQVARVTLYVRKENIRAVALYARNGFADVGSVSRPSDPFPERKMTRELR